MWAWGGRFGDACGEDLGGVILFVVDGKVEVRIHGVLGVFSELDEGGDRPGGFSTFGAVAGEFMAGGVLVENWSAAEGCVGL